jgi:hypothetical protein
MPFNILQVIIIVLIAVSLVALTFPWTARVINESMDTVEVSFIKSQFDTCSDRILETARTGASNKCFFNINRGALTGKAEGLDYTIASTTGICDSHPLTEIDERRHIWQSCSRVGGLSVYEMLWMFPQELEVEGTGVQGSKVEGETSSGSITIGNNGEIVFRTLSVYVGFDYTPGETGNVVDMSRVSITDEDVKLRIRLS